MKVLFVSSSYSNFYAIDDIVRRLFQRGHDVRLILGMDEKATIADDALQHIRKDIPGLVIEPLKSRKTMWKFTRLLREVLNYAHVLNNENTRKWDVAKWFRFFPPFLWKIVSTPAGRKSLKKPQVQNFLRALEQRIPVDHMIREHIQRHAPDIIIVMPLINPASKETEYLRAARAMGILVLYSMVSWDNISSKGTFHGKPDYSVVWNEPLALELSSMHDIPRERIFITGAPRFDHLIDKVDGRIMPHTEFCRMVGLDEKKEYILYVGSTFLVTNDHKKNADESVLVLEVADALAKDPRTKDVNLVLRPHPTNSTFLEKIRAQARPNIIVFPHRGEIPDTEEKRSRFHNSLFHSLAVVGVNTTAFLEASALDKPCITIQTQNSVETQMLLHFHHLADAGFLETALGVDELVDVVGKIKSGVDARRDQRREFVKNFLRPRGIPAVDAYVKMIETLGSHSEGNKTE
ncbi:MAG: hypothetical protein J0M11_07540 [Anaerolineae bacterium]|nr:hypothetical protein [Anaerolineae bacterium]